ncbi:MAG TPA: hypothetical protein PK152_20865 [Anaerolineales bacterium]|jgi:hypothetical protein|nr:hypothetical protein [Anaerolineae bacterium]HRJ56453.1 hypothetical protein [Anaerolineales bacterium]HRK91589.1 hypothetical protein [Anaerolineales bacterium]
MKIHYQQTGGFMGRLLELDLNLDEEPEEQAGALRNLIDTSDFMNLKEENPASLYGRDSYHYRIMVETETIQHSVHVTDMSMPAALRPLIEELSRLARTKRGK